MPATFVLVHGAWIGGWYWKKVTPLLRSAGHEVYTPTLTGLGERTHLFTPEVGLDTHIEDVVAILEFEDLRDVILVGHSYAGMVITGVAQRAAHRLSQLVYLDAFLPANGKSLNDYLPEPPRGADGRIEPLDFSASFDVTNESDIAWMAPRLRHQPERCFSQPVEVSTSGVLRKTYIQNSRLPHFEEAAGRAKQEGFRFLEQISANHCPMITQPEELAKILLALV
jgi:pimeloyl-ACP methyl ester carboxylesterase